MHCSGGLWSCEKIGIGRFPSLHHRKEGWPSDQKIIAKPPLIARPGWFSDENKRKTTPAASASVAARNFLDDAATPPCGDARRGITLDSNLFTAPMSADNPAGATLSTVREAQARQRAASKNAKRKRDSAQPQKTRSASATARSLKKREAQARQRAASKNAKRKRDSAQPQKIDRRYSESPDIRAAAL